MELFVKGHAAQSDAALRVVRHICESWLPGRHHLDVIDIRERPHRARDAGIPAVPALVRRQPEPVLLKVGRLSEARVLRGLGLVEPDPHEGEADDDATSTAPP